MKHIENMNKYLADLMVWNVKLHNLHWNVRGMQFMQVHNFTEELYEDAFEKLDDVAERIKMLGKNPVATVTEYLSLCGIKETSADSFNSEEVLKSVKSDLEYMKKAAVKIRNTADAEGDFISVSMFEDHIGGFEKKLWFLSSMLA